MGTPARQAVASGSIQPPTHQGLVWPHLVVLNQDVAGSIEDLRVQRVRVLGQGVVIVKAVHLDVAQADLIVGIDGCGVQETAHLGGQEVYRRRCQV